MSERRAAVREEFQSGETRLVEGPSVLDWPLEAERVEGGVLLSLGRHRVVLDGEACARLREFLGSRRGG